MLVKEMGPLPFSFLARNGFGTRPLARIAGVGLGAVLAHTKGLGASLGETIASLKIKRKIKMIINEFEFRG